MAPGTITRVKLGRDSGFLSLPPFWGSPTSNIDWCEDNYAISSYFAEFWNTMSALEMLLVYGYATYVSFAQNLEPRYKCWSLYVLGVTLGTWIFHMTLINSVQFLDEVPMLFGSAMYLYSVFETNGSTVGANWHLLLGLHTLVIVSSTYYIVTNNSSIFQIMFGIYALSAALRSWWLGYKYPFTRKTIYIGTAFFAVGCTFWFSEFFLCSHLISLRSPGGFLSATFAQPLTEFHAIWHILSCIGVYCGFVISIQIRSLHLILNGKKATSSNFFHVKHLLGFYPYFVTKEKVDHNEAIASIIDVNDLNANVVLKGENATNLGIDYDENVHFVWREREIH